VPPTPREAKAVAHGLCDYIGNPFLDAARHARSGELAADWLPHARDLLAALIGAGETGLARRALVALCMRELADGDDAGQAVTRQCTDEQLARLRLPRDAVERQAAAAARCQRALSAVRGGSAGIRHVRATTWKACFGDSVYESIRMQPFVRRLNVMIRGETGTGKELVARAIAVASPQPDRYQALNAAAIPEQLLESELFGHRRGAFTGADEDREGKLVAASGGTVFLDELADLPGPLQPKLLRVIETNEVTPVGANEPHAVDLRYVSATSEPIESQVDAGEFRRDLYQRLAGVTIEIPPLRSRPEDLQPIAEAILERLATGMGLTARDRAYATSTAELSKLDVVQARLLAWLAGDEAARRPWHGNVRELENVIRSGLLGLDETRPPDDSTPPVDGDPPAPDPGLQRFIDARAPLRELEDWYVRHVLAASRYNQRKAAKVLGIDRGTLARRLKKIESEG
jgi:transcriptional regulator with AAA-type ATPase domain